MPKIVSPDIAVVMSFVQFNLTVERYALALLRHYVDRRAAVVEHVNIEFIRVFIVLHVKLHVFSVAFRLRYLEVLCHSAEVEALSSAVGHVVGPSEVWQIRHHAVAFNPQVEVCRQLHRHAPRRVSRLHVYLEVAVAHRPAYHLCLLLFFLSFCCLSVVAHATRIIAAVIINKILFICHIKNKFLSFRFLSFVSSLRFPAISRCCKISQFLIKPPFL